MSRLEKIIAGKTPLVTAARYEFRPPQPPIECKDGTTLSVQASSACYCSPRDNYGPYSHVEVAYPSAPVPDSWLEYAASQDERQGVFGYVPVALVREFVAAHGGEVEAT